jgi:hypothetical protein
MSQGVDRWLKILNVIHISKNVVHQGTTMKNTPKRKYINKVKYSIFTKNGSF